MIQFLIQQLAWFDVIVIAVIVILSDLYIRKSSNSKYLCTREKIEDTCVLAFIFVLVYVVFRL